MEPPGAIGTGAPDELGIPLQQVEVARRSEGLEFCLRVVADTRKVKVGRMACDKMELG